MYLRLVVVIRSSAYRSYVHFSSLQLPSDHTIIYIYIYIYITKIRFFWETDCNITFFLGSTINWKCQKRANT
ncbi:hypothetical protein ACMBCM_05290, partial [Spiroplasma sp. K1]